VVVDVSFNRFDYDASSQLTNVVQRCKEPAFSCIGLPPVSCSAFGPGWMVKARDPDTCEPCASILLSITLLGVGSVLLVLGVGGYIWFITKYPDAIQRTVSTATIVLNHVQFEA